MNGLSASSWKAGQRVHEVLIRLKGGIRKEAPMLPQLTMGPYCQSCGMPLGKEDFGTDAQDCPVSDYCRFCFAHGAYTAPKISMQEMIDRAVEIMAERGIMPEERAWSLMTEVIPKLKRWREARRGHLVPA
jgi:hypothetical protein